MGALMPRTTSTTPRPTPSPPTSSLPVYYYKSRTPSVHTSDYIYYYSPRDLVQLKLAARKHERHINTENTGSISRPGASPLTSSSQAVSSSWAFFSLNILLVSASLL